MKYFCLLVSTLFLAASGEDFNFSGRPEGINIARFKSVTVSKAGGEDPSKAVDGSGAVRFGPTGKCYRSAGDQGGWIRIDLGKTETIHAMEIFTSDHDPGTSTYAARREGDRDLEVRIGDDPNFQNNPVCATFGDPFVARRAAAYCDRVLCGRYISIQRTTANTGVFHVCEFLAFYLAGTICEEPTTTPEPTTPEPTTPEPTTPEPTTPPTTTPEPIDPCPLPKEVGNCASKTTRYFFKPEKAKCIAFDGCSNVENANNFASEAECKTTCAALLIPSPPECLLNPDVGNGDQMVTKFYYVPGAATCRKMKYSGSGGNANRFDTKGECAENCKNK